MNLQFAFLLTFIAGGLSAWMLIRASRQAKQRRMDIIQNKIGSIGGNVFSIELIDRKGCPFSGEFEDPDLAYKFYKISYQVDCEMKQGWAILKMKQRSYGPGGAIDSRWVWRL